VQKRNPQLHHALDTSDINEFLSAYLFVKTAKPRQDGTTKPFWYLRITKPNDSRIERGLRVEHVDDASTKEAIEIGEQLFERIKNRYQLGLTEDEKNIVSYAKDFLADAKKGMLENEKLIEAGYEPIHRNKLTGNMLWNRKNWRQQEHHFLLVLEPFFSKENHRKPISRIHPKDIAEWDTWRKLEAKKDGGVWSPSTIQKQNTHLRFVFKWAQLQGESVAIPNIPEMPKNLAMRRRPEVDDDTLQAIYSYLRDRNGMNPESVYASSIPDWKEDNYYIFYCYLETLEHFGIRGGVGDNPIKMQDIKRETDEHGKPRFFMRRVEKNRDPYEAAGYRYWEKTWNRLNRFYKAKDMPNRTYLFEHWKDKPPRKKGDPIKGFRKAWNTMADELGFNYGVTEANKKIVPYSIRHRYIGRRLMESGANPLIIAKSVGTSLQMIDKIYLHYEVRKNYDKLVQTDIDYEKRIDIYGSSSGKVVKRVDRNSPEHFEEWKANKENVEAAPEG